MQINQSITIHPSLQNAKLLADSVEALIGAFVLGSSEKNGYKLLEHLNMITIPWQEVESFGKEHVEGWEPFFDMHAVEKLLGYVLNDSAFIVLHRVLSYTLTPKFIKCLLIINYYLS